MEIISREEDYKKCLIPIKVFEQEYNSFDLDIQIEFQEQLIDKKIEGYK